MKTEVTIDGVRLTRAQVERAYKEINTPIQAGDRVRRRCPSPSRSEFIILDPFAAKILQEHGGWGFEVLGVNLNSGQVASFNRAELETI